MEQKVKSIYTKNADIMDLSLSEIVVEVLVEKFKWKQCQRIMEQFK